MNSNIFLASVLFLVNLSSASTVYANDRNLKAPAPVERVKPRKTELPPPVAPVAPVFEDRGSSDFRRPDPRGSQYINLNSGNSGSTAGAQPEREAKIEKTFCQYLLENESRITQPINTCITKKFSFDSARAEFQYLLLGLSNKYQPDGNIPAFVYELTTGTILVLSADGSSAAPHKIPQNVVIIDKDKYMRDGFWTETKKGIDPLCGSYVNLADRQMCGR